MKTSVGLFICLIAAIPSWAQTQTTRFDVGVHVEGAGLFLRGSEVVEAVAPTGLGAAINARLASRLTLAGRVTWFPERERIEFESQGGRTTEASVGLRAALVASRHYSISAQAGLGLIHFTDALVIHSEEAITGVTHAAINGGVGLDFFPSARLIAHFDFGQSAYHTPGFSQLTVGPTGRLLALVTAPAEWHTLNEVSVGLGYRLGALRPAPERDTARAGDKHRFLDTLNVALIGAEVGTEMADSIRTERALKREPDRYTEGDPLARPFVNAGWPGVAIGNALFSAGAIALQYVLHRTNHHRAERWFPVFMSVYELHAALRAPRSDF